MSEGVEKAIRRFIVNFSLLEAHLRGIIVEIPNISAPVGEILTSTINFRTLVNVFGTIVHEYCQDQEIIKLSDQVLKDIENINEYRNNLVHSQWFPDIDEPEIAMRVSGKANRKTGYKARIESLKQDDILEKCDQTARLTYTLSEIYDKIKLTGGAYE